MVALPVRMSKRGWTDPHGRSGAFRPNGALALAKPRAGKSPFLTPNWRGDTATWSARIFVGFSVGNRPTYDMQDLVTLVRDELEKQGAPDASFVYQKGIYSHTDGSHIVEEDGAQVVIINLAKLPPKKFEQKMVELGNRIRAEFQQETVIVEIQRDGVVKETIGITAEDPELDYYESLSSGELEAQDMSDDVPWQDILASLQRIERRLDEQGQQIEAHARRLDRLEQRRAPTPRW